VIDASLGRTLNLECIQFYLKQEKKKELTAVLVLATNSGPPLSPSQLDEYPPLGSAPLIVQYCPGLSELGHGAVEDTVIEVYIRFEGIWFVEGVF